MCIIVKEGKEEGVDKLNDGQLEMKTMCSRVMAKSVGVPLSIEETCNYFGNTKFNVGKESVNYDSLEKRKVLAQSFYDDSRKTTLSLQQANQIELSLDNNLSNDFIYNDHEFVSSNNGCLYYRGAEVMNCLVRIDANIVSERKNNYMCSVYINGQVVTVTILAKDFVQGYWLYNKVPGFATSCYKAEAGKIIYKYLNNLIKKFANKNLWRTVRKPGWRLVNGRFMYVTPQGVIGIPNVNIVAEYGQKFGDLTNKQVGNFHSFIRMMYLTPNTWTAPILLLYTVMGFSLTLFKKAGTLPKFLIFINGARGSYKTTLALVMTQIERNDSPEYNLKSTSAGIEAGYRKFKDAIMLVDDLAPAQEIRDQRKLHENLELVTRAFGDGSGKKRNPDYQDENFEVEQYEAEGGMVVTGEYKTGCDSSLSRRMFLSLRQNDVDLSLLTALQEEKTCLSAFVWGYIEFLTNHCNEIIDFIKRNNKEYMKKYSKLYSHSRYREYHSQLMVSAKLLLKFGLDTKQITVNEAEQYMCFLAKCIQEAIDYNNQSLVEESPLVLLCRAIVTKIEERMFSIIPLGTVINDTNNIILESENNYYIRQKDVLAMKEKYDMENGFNQMKYSSSTLAEMLYNAGIIKKYQEGKTIRFAKKIYGVGNGRFMEVDKKRLYEKANI